MPVFHSCTRRVYLPTDMPKCVLIGDVLIAGSGTQGGRSARRKERSLKHCLTAFTYSS